MDFFQANGKALKFGCNGLKGEGDVAMEGVKLKKNIKKIDSEGLRNGKNLLKYQYFQNGQSE